MEILISEITIDGRHRKDMGDVQALADSITTVGLLHPVVLTPEKRLVAGERRLAAYRLLGREKIPANIAKNLDEARLLLQAENDENTCRLNFAPTEARAMADALKPIMEELAKAAQKEGQKAGGKTAGKGRPKNSFGRSSTKAKPKRDDKKRSKRMAAGPTGYSEDTLEKVRAVEASGYLDLIAAISKSGAKVDNIFKKMKTRQKADADAKAAKEASKIIGKGGENHGVLLGDFKVGSLAIPDASVALIFTDPPYDRDSLGLFDDIAALADRILVDGGSLVTFCGQYVLPEVIARLSSQGRLRYFWICAVQHTGDRAQMKEYGIKVLWKPLLWFVKGTFRRDRNTWVEDLVLSREEKNLHVWQQSVIEASHFIGKLTMEGEFVVDPCCGAGTTAFAAKRLGRQWLTYDVDPTAVKTARERIAEA